MVGVRFFLVILLMTFIPMNRAFACSMVAPRILEDVLYADIVVIGQIKSSARILPREHYVYCKLNKVFNAKKCAEKNYMTDYYRITISVGEVIIGLPARTLVFTSAYVPDKRSTISYLIALQSSNSKQLPLRGPSATIFPSPEPNIPRLLGAPCAPSFLIEGDKPDVTTIRQILKRGRRT
jgi:hypothetical protein